MSSDPNPTLLDRAFNKTQSAYPWLWDGLLGMWVPALGRTGLTLFDVGGRKDHGVLVNGPVWVASLNGGALQFDIDQSGDEHVLFPDNSANLSLGTVFLRLRRTAAFANNGTVLWLPTDDTLQDRLFNSGAGLKWRTYDTGNNNNQSLTHTLTLNQWYNYTMTISSSSRKWYIDGQIFDTDTPNSGSYRPWYLKYLGWSGVAGQSFAGEIESVAVWNRVLLPSEVQQLHRDRLAPLRLRDTRIPIAGEVAVGNPWYYYAQQAAIIG